MPWSESAQGHRLGNGGDMLKRYLPIAAAAAACGTLLGGCSSTLKATALGADGRFATGAKVAADDVSVKQPFDRAKFGKLAYVKKLGDNQTMNSFFHDSIVNTKMFENVVDQSGMEKLVIQHNIENVSGADSLIALHKLQAEIGPFLVIEPYVEWKGGYNYEASLKVVDPDTTETIFSAKKKAFNWGGLDKPLFYPLFNALLDWLNNRPIDTAAPPPAPVKG